jgi:hypothetical protein
VVRKGTTRRASKGQQDVKARKRAAKLERRSLTFNAKKTAGKLFQARGASPLPLDHVGSYVQQRQNRRCQEQRRQQLVPMQAQQPACLLRHLQEWSTRAWP